MAEKSKVSSEAKKPGKTLKEKRSAKNAKQDAQQVARTMRDK